ncbi:MAG: hypothetical protein H6831_13555 [Planctomycetes bacterium]|nr:hypothetical protein [Planctomycetota bacterium]
MGDSLTWCAAALALLPAVLGGDALASLDDRSRLAFALVPWLLLAGLPRRAPLNAGFALGLALPTLALAAWLDARGGFAWSQLAPRAGWALVCAAVVNAASRRAAGSTRYGSAWLLAWIVVPAFAGLVAMLAGGGGPAWADWGGALSGPARALTVTADPGLAPLDALALATACALVWIASARPRRAD